MSARAEDGPVGAREALEDHLIGIQGMPEDKVFRMLDAYAHELAEEIRAETRQLKADGVLEPDKFRPCRDAADQIDPESDYE